jgi:hypothetical protein
MSYEFTSEQNDLIGRLARKMSLVGLVSLIFGIFYLLAAVLLIVYLFQDRLPPEVAQQIPEDVRAKMPAPTTYFWGVIVQTALAGLIFTMIGVWTRSAASSFREIVATTGRDISHLMNALGSLHKMYSLLYTLIIITILAFLIALGFQLFMRYKG